MHYSQQEQRLLQMGERLYEQLYGRFSQLVSHPGTRSEVGLRLLIGQAQLRGSPISLSRGPLDMPDSISADLTNHARIVLAKIREQYRGEIAPHVITIGRNQFTVGGLSDLYRAYRSIYMRGSATNWPSYIHESVLFSMYILYENNAPAVFTSSAYMSLVSSIAIQNYEAEHGSSADSRPTNDTLLRPDFDTGNPTFTDPDDPWAKRRRTSCRLCGSAKLATTTCRVCGYTPRRV